MTTRDVASELLPASDAGAATVLAIVFLAFLLGLLIGAWGGTRCERARWCRPVPTLFNRQTTNENDDDPYYG